MQKPKFMQKPKLELPNDPYSLIDNKGGIHPYYLSQMYIRIHKTIAEKIGEETLQHRLFFENDKKKDDYHFKLSKQYKKYFYCALKDKKIKQELASLPNIEAILSIIGNATSGHLKDNKKKYNALVHEAIQNYSFPSETHPNEGQSEAGEHNSLVSWKGVRKIKFNTKPRKITELLQRCDPKNNPDLKKQYE